MILTYPIDRHYRTVMDSQKSVLSLGSSPFAKRAGMVSNVIAHKGGDEKIAVVVAVVHSQL